MTLNELYEGSYVKTLVESSVSVQQRLEPVYAHSRIRRTLSTGVAYIYHSRIGQWLTAEPEPDVVVIDLRETYTVGPFLAVLDRIVPILEASWEGSRSTHAAVAAERRLRDRPIRILSVVLFGALLANTILWLGGTNPTLPELGVRIALLVVAVIGTRIRLSWDDLVETRLFEILVALFEPPEIPAEGDPEGRHDRDGEKEAERLHSSANSSPRESP